MKREIYVCVLSTALVASRAFAQEPTEPSGSSAEPPATAAPAAASADAPTSSSAPAEPSLSPGAAERPHDEPAERRFDLVRVNAGVKLGYVASRGFDTFASSDVLPQFSIDGAYPLLTRGNFVVAAGLGWDMGWRSDGLRGLDAGVTAHRFYVPVEGRWHMVPWLYGFAKVSPGAAVLFAHMADESASIGGPASTLSDTGWAFAADASVGGSVLLGPDRRLEKRSLRFWLTPELGWSLTTRAPLSMSVDRDPSERLGTDEDLRLRSVALSGFFWRASVGATF